MANKGASMKIECQWNEKLKFTATADSHSVTMDAKAPMGTDGGATPKQLLLMAICGCTGMDVVSLLKKYKQEASSFSIDAEANATTSHPAVFTDINLVFNINGEVEATRAAEAARLSMTKYCSVSAMVSAAVPIHYRVVVNGKRHG
jgi:putative redox protein